MEDKALVALYELYCGACAGRDGTTAGLAGDLGKEFGEAPFHTASLALLESVKHPENCVSAVVESLCRRD